MRSRRLLLGGILPAALLAIAGCSSSATAAPAGSTGPAAGSGVPTFSIPSFSLPSGLGAGTGLDASTVLTPDVAASIIGGTATVAPGSITTGPLSILSYTNASGDEVTMLVETLPGGVQQAILQAALAQAGAAGDLQPVSGLGDTGGKIVGANDATVAFAKNNTIVVLTATSSASAGTDLDTKLEALAQTVLGKL
jgi:hypothetical protein